MLLVRHGQTMSNVTSRYAGWIDEDLNNRGLQQAQQLAERLKNWRIDSAYSSPLKRAFHTAEIIATPHSLSVNKLDDLGEIRMGLWEGLSAAQIEVKFPEEWKQWRSDPSNLVMPEGESIGQVQKRAILALQRTIKANPGCQVLVATHDAILKLSIAYCLNVSPSIYRRIEIANASLTIISITDGKWRLSLLNDTAHLTLEQI